MKNLALKNNEETNPMSKTEFVQRLRDIGKERYQVIIVNFIICCIRGNLTKVKFKHGL